MASHTDPEIPPILDQPLRPPVAVGTVLAALALWLLRQPFTATYLLIPCLGVAVFVITATTLSAYPLAPGATLESAIEFANQALSELAAEIELAQK